MWRSRGRHARAKDPVLAYVTISSTEPERLIDFYTRLMRLAVTVEAGAFTVVFRSRVDPMPPQG
jgi:hypothetical protein